MRILLIIILVVLSLSNVGLWIEHAFVMSDVRNLRQTIHQTLPNAKPPTDESKSTSPPGTPKTQPPSPPDSKHPTKKSPSKKPPVKDFECINRNDC